MVYLGVEPTLADLTAQPTALLKLFPSWLCPVPDTHPRALEALALLTLDLTQSVPL